MSRPPPRLKPGDLVYLENMPILAPEVVDVSDPALVTLRAPNGATPKAGRKTVIRVETGEPS